MQGIQVEKKIQKKKKLGGGFGFPRFAWVHYCGRGHLKKKF